MIRLLFNAEKALKKYITGLGIYGIFGTVFAMQPDAIDYSEWKKNRSISGTIAAFQGLFRSLEIALGSKAIGRGFGIFRILYLPRIDKERTVLL